MLGSIVIIVGVMFGVVSLLVTGSFGGNEEELVSETVSSGESIDVIVEDDGAVVVASTEPSVQGTNVPTASPEPADSDSRDGNTNNDTAVYTSEDGTTRVETQVTEGHAQVKVRQNVTSSGSVKSKTHVKVSTE